MIAIFEFKSGCNPYIAKNYEDAQKVKEIYRSQGIRIKEIHPDYFIIYD